MLNISENEYSKVPTKTWDVIDSETKGNYSHENPIKFLTSLLKSSLLQLFWCICFSYRNIAFVRANNNTKVALKNWAPFRKCRTKIIETFIDEAEHINIAMPIYNLIECSDNYSVTSGSLWQFKRDEIEDVDLTVDDNHVPNNSSPFKCKSSLITDRNGLEIVVPLKHLSNFWRSLEMLLISCKAELSLAWDQNCVLSNLAGASTFTITDAKRYVLIVTLSTVDNAKLSKLLSEGFKRPVYWNKYKKNSK